MRIKYTNVKDVLDYIGATIGLLFAAPFFLVIPVLLKLDSPGPVFYRQERLGRNGRRFKIWKFRSMRMDAEAQSGPVWATQDDPRVTRFGKFLRKSHLDELPQLFNVLCGEMSLIGPRPERPEFVEKLEQQIPRYTHRLQVKPGITGLAQIRHRYDSTLQDVRRKIRYDMIYIQKACLLLDLKIAYRTLRKMVLQIEY